MSSPGTGSEQQSAPPAAQTDVPAVPPPVQVPAPPAQPPAQPPAPTRDNSRDVISALNALPEKIANVLLERSPVATPQGQQASVPAQVGSNSPGTDSASAGTQSSPGQGNNAVPPVTAPPADAPSKTNKFADWWFKG